jgi:carboxyl-terminal processing protease
MIYHFFTPKSEEDIEAPESSESAKSEMRPFFAGVVFGVVFLLVLGAAYRGLANVYSQVTHQPISTEEKLNEIMQLLETHSINTYKEEELKENMYRGLLAGVGDPYTSYFDKKSLDSFMQSTEGSYAGIGVVVTTDPKDKLITVVSAYENAPGAMAGIIAGDKFLKINGLDVTNASLDDVTSMTKGQAGTSVKITIFRESENRQFDVNVVRKKIDIPTIASKSFDNIGYIQITAFDRVTLEQFKTAYAEVMETK